MTRFPTAAALALFAASTSAAAPALTLDQLHARYLAARGGQERLRAIQSLRLTGKVMMGPDGRVRASWGGVFKRPSMLRTETTLQGLTSVVAYDGAEGWRVSPFGGRRDPERVSADDARGLAQDADLEGHLVGYAQKGHRAEYLGQEDVDGTPAHKIRLTLKDGDVEYHYLDPDHFLPVRLIVERKVRGSERVHETDYGSYGQVEGVWIPFVLESGKKGGPKTIRHVIERAEANVPVDDSIFKLPAAGAPKRVVVAGPKGAEVPPWKGAPAAKGAPVLDPGVLSGMGARNIGSAAISGRISALAARHEGGKTLIYVGAASGGVWKSQDGATTFKPVFDKQPVQSIGAVAIAPSDPKTVWVGTGEAWTRNSVSIGDGIYKSVDGGETWAHMGLRESERIVRILIHPRNADVVYACVPGKLWSDSAERGVFKTTDGGKTWAQVLKGPNLSTGCGSLAMDPKDPEVLLAGTWDFRRKGWTFRSGGEGPEANSGSGLFRTADGGRSWKELAAGGLPSKPWGRVEVAVAPSDPRIVYALVESKASALYRSADGGATWEARDRSQMMVWRPFYFARLIVDPVNPDRLFKPNLTLIVSEDGGKSFAPSGGRGHGDWHDLWIDPENPKHLIGGDDGGLWISRDGGNGWWKAQNLPVSQFYHVSIDDRDPYHVYGGLQDNGTWTAPSAKPGGINNAAWQLLYWGDGFWAWVDPTDPDAVYAEAQGGYIARVDRRTGNARDIQPKGGYLEKLRFNWNTPIHVGAKGALYIGAQYLFRTRDRGHTWERISPDLSTNDPEKQKQEESGGVTVDNSSAEMHTSIYAISESPLDPRTVWVGTDDGNLQLTRDGGKHWVNLAANVKGLPRASWVSWVEASRFSPGVAYAAFDRHTFGDMAPWVFRTADFGKTWTRITGPEHGVRGYAHVIREDPVEKDLLYCGTELGLWISVDGGKRWAELKGGGFPAVAVREVQVHSRDHDLVLATHGRGIWIVDDVTPLRALARSQELLARDAAFLPGRPVQQRMEGIGGWPEGDAAFIGENPPSGAVITYYQRTRHLFGPISVQILDPSGAVIETFPGSQRRGINRVRWSMQVKAPAVPRGATVSGSATRGPRVMPGTYTVRLIKGAETIESKLEIGLDRRASYTVAERREQLEQTMKVHALFGAMSAVTDRIDAARSAAQARLQGLGEKDALAAPLRSFDGTLEQVRKKVVATKEGGAITGEERIREHADDVYGALLSYEGKPARYLVERTEALGRQLEDVRKELEAAFAGEGRKLNGELAKRTLEPLPLEGGPPAVSAESP